jgi:hypothetical protein
MELEEPFESCTSLGMPRDLKGVPRDLGGMSHSPLFEPHSRRRKPSELQEIIHKERFRSLKIEGQPDRDLLTSFAEEA